MKRSRKTTSVTRLHKVKLVPVTDPAKQAAIDRLFKNGKITKEDKKILMDQPDRQKK